jgi:hypothetical protein
MSSMNASSARCKTVSSWLQNIRALCGLDQDTSCSDEYHMEALYGHLVLLANNVLDHVLDVKY